MTMGKKTNKKTSKSNITNGDTENEFPPGMAPKILNMIQVVDELEKELEPLVSKPHHEVLSKMSSLEKSKIGMLETYTINSLFWVLMKTSKDEVEPTLREDFKVEMGRLKEIQGRISEVESRAERPQVNTEIASRLIRRGIGDKGPKNSKRRKTKHEKTEEMPDDCENQNFKSAWR